MISIFGWVGAVISLYAYYSVSTNRMEGTSLKFQSLNILGAVLIFINSTYYGAFPSAMVNFCWIAIALVSINQFRRVRGSKGWIKEIFCY